MRYYCLVASADGARLWLVPEGDAWSLPWGDSEAGWLPNAVAALQHHFRTRYGIEIVVLREILRDDDDETSICEVAALDAAAYPGGNWHDAAEATAALRHPAHRAAVARWQADEGVETHLGEWQRRGWFELAHTWIVEAVRGVGLDVNGTVTQVKAGWNLSAVLAVPTAGGRLIFKASPPRRPGEPAALAAFPRRWWHHLPELIAADRERCWMLVREVDGEVIDPEDRLASAEAARLYARIQIDQASDPDRWCALGCPDRGLETMEREIPRLLLEIPDRLASSGVITAAERDEIASFVPQAAAGCRELATFAVPVRSIHHEDFRSGNVLRRRDGTLVILDWNETAVAHPFFSVQRYLWFILPPDGATRHEILATESDALRRAVRDAYLEPFAGFEPPRRLLEAFHLSSQLAPVYDALRFQAGVDLDQVFARGLIPKERRIARDLMDHLLEVTRVARRRARRRAWWAWPWTRRAVAAAPAPTQVSSPVASSRSGERKTVTMSDCVVCTTLEEPGRSRDMWVFEDDLVLLGHIGPTPGLEDGYPGQMLLVPRRHVTSPGALTQAEAERIGLWLSRGARLLEEIRGAEHVYVWRLGDGWGHVHFHLVPRYPGTPEAFYGPAIRDWPGVPRYGWPGLAAIAADLRRAAAALDHVGAPPS